MDKQKQIEEIVKYHCDLLNSNGICKEDNELCCLYNGKFCMVVENAKTLLDKLIPEGAVVLTREEYDKIYERAEATVLSNIADGGTSCHWCGSKHEKIGYEQGVKDAAEKIQQAIVDNTYPYFDKDGKPVNIWKATTGFDRIDEIAKEITEGV